MAKAPRIIQSTSQASFRTTELDTFVNQWAMDTLWEKSYVCPCLTRNTKQADPSCPNCKGRMFAFLPPKHRGIIIQAQEKGVFNGDLGLIDTGTAIGTPERSDELIAFRDRITLPHVQIPHSYIFDVTEKRVANGIYIPYDVRSIDYIRTMEKELVEGEDYTFNDETNTLMPNESLVDKNVTMNISTTLRYLVNDLLKEHRYQKVVKTIRNKQEVEWEKLNQKLLLKREDIFIDKEAFELGVETTDVIDPKRKPASTNLNGFFTRPE